MLGALFGLAVSFAAMLGSVLHQCLPGSAAYIPLLVVEFIAWGFLLYIPALIIGFVIGFFMPGRLLLALGVVLMVAALAYGWTTALNYCLPV